MYILRQNNVCRVQSIVHIPYLGTGLSRARTRAVPPRPRYSQVIRLFQFSQGGMGGTMFEAEKGSRVRLTYCPPPCLLRYGLPTPYILYVQRHYYVNMYKNFTHSWLFIHIKNDIIKEFMVRQTIWHWYTCRYFRISQKSKNHKYAKISAAKMR